MGTTAKAAVKLGRRFVTFEIEQQYIEHIKKTFLPYDKGEDGLNINWINVSIHDNESITLFSNG